MEPKRNCKDEMTKEYYPESITMEEFIEEIEEGLRLFKMNLQQHYDGKSMYVEDWMDMFQRYMEMY